ncbi:CMRF35-like molecule 7 isoform 2-T2 [Chlamydotis macqueenii]
MNNHGEKATWGASSWRMRILLVWTLFPGGWAVTGPTQVMAEQGGSLPVSCSYEPGYESYPKYWCRPGFLWLCFTDIAKTDGSEVTVTQGRVSIRDDHAAHSFMVMLGNVTLEDAGWYSCGVKRTLWFGRRHTTEVMVSAAVSTMPEGRDVSPLDTTTGCQEPPVRVKVPVALALACGVLWARSRRRSCQRENLQQFEAADGTGTLDRPPTPTTPEPRGRPPAPLPPTLLALRHPSRPSRVRSCLAPGPSPPAKPQPLLAAPALQRGGFGAQRARAC